MTKRIVLSEIEERPNWVSLLFQTDSVYLFNLFKARWRSAHFDPKVTQFTFDKITFPPMFGLECADPAGYVVTQ